MSVALLIPLQDTAENTAGALVIIAATGAALVAIWGLVIRAGKTRPGRWTTRRFVIPLRRVFIDERRDRKRAEANARILKVVEEAFVPMIAPLATQIAEIAHSTNGKGPDDLTMSAEITALTATVGDIAKGMAGHRLKIEEIIGEQLTPRLSALEASQKVSAALLSDLTGRVAMLEGKPHHDPYSQPSAAHPSQHRRHDDD